VGAASATDAPRKKKKGDRRQTRRDSASRANPRPGDRTTAARELERPPGRRAEIALNAQLQGEFTRAISPILKQILEEDHLGVIIEYPSEFVIFVDPSADITEKVIQRLAAAEKPKNDR
jgi:Skp family chaperone for outer membrane proteins